MVKILPQAKIDLFENSLAEAKVPLETGGNRGTSTEKICSGWGYEMSSIAGFVVMKNSGRIAIIGLAIWMIATVAQAAGRASTHAEREQTRMLNEQQLELARHRNAGLPINAGSLARDASAKAPDNSPPAAAPTMAVERAQTPPPGAALPPMPGSERFTMRRSEMLSTGCLAIGLAFVSVMGPPL